MAKRLVGTILMLVIILIVSCSDKTTSYSYDEIKNQIENFTQDLKENKDNYQVKEVDLYDVSSQGGMIVGYYHDKELRHIEVGIFGEMGRVLYDVYYINEGLIYLIKVDIEYDKPVYEDDFKVLEENIDEYIIISNKIFEYDKELKTVSDETASEYKVLIEDFEEMLENVK